MPDTLTIADRARRIIADHLTVPVAELTDDARLDRLGADSLDLIELQVAFEEAVDVHIADEAIDDWETIGDLVKAVEAQRG